MEENKTDNNFRCLGCGQAVEDGGPIGTRHRNHCPRCLASCHVDRSVSGDRAATCQALMTAVGLTFKQEGNDKWGKPKPGEVMLIHECSGCGHLSINRIAGDDAEEALLVLLEREIDPGLSARISQAGIRRLGQKDRMAVRESLFGK